MLVGEYSDGTSGSSTSKKAKSRTMRVAMRITHPSRFLLFASSSLSLSSISLDVSSGSIS